MTNESINTLSLILVADWAVGWHLALSLSVLLLAIMVNTLHRLALRRLDGGHALLHTRPLLATIIKDNDVQTCFIGVTGRTCYKHAAYFSYWLDWTGAGAGAGPVAIVG
jgi:hypothetical protein